MIELATGIAMLDRHAKRVIVGVRARLSAERRVEVDALRNQLDAIRAADAAELARFANEIEMLRNEMRADRRALAEARNEVRTTMTAEEIRALEEPFIADIVGALQRAVQVSSPLAIAVGLTRVARALGASSPENRCFLALEMLAVASQLDPDAMGAKWQ
jgi:hypothetical protein